MTQKQTVQDLYHDHLVCATVDLPSHIKLLSDRINNLYTVDVLIRNHTLYSYYESYLTIDKARKIYLLMSKGSTRGEVHASLGLTASLIKSSKHLKFCKSCYLEDISHYNEPYWHCAHQIPGVYICHLHQVSLTNTKISCPSRDHKFEFVPLIQISQKQLIEDTIPPSWWDHLVSIAEYSTKLMSLEDTHKDTTKCYKAKLYKMGYVTPSGQLRFIQIIRDFLAFFPNDLLQFLDCNISHENKDTWIHKILRGKQRIFHPLRHLLVHIFLDLDLSEVIFETTTPFGNGPWPCLNKAAKHHMENVTDQCTVTRGSKSGKSVVGTFSCSCGFIYSRTGPDEGSEDRTRIGRIKSFGHDWVEMLQQLNQQSISLRAKAKLLGVDPGTVKIQTARLITNQSAECKDIDQEKAIRCGRFLSSIMEAKKNSIPNRQVNTKDYAWLYRNDRTWLLHVISENKKDYIKQTKIDWKKRDKEILKEVRKAIKEVGYTDKPKRITIVEIAKNMNGTNGRLLFHSLQKLPRTKEFLGKRIETTEQYQTRRLGWAFEKLKKEQPFIKGWHLLKKAGLNKPLGRNVENIFIKLIADYDIYLTKGRRVRL